MHAQGRPSNDEAGTSKGGAVATGAADVSESPDPERSNKPDEQPAAAKGPASDQLDTIPVPGTSTAVVGQVDTGASAQQIPEIVVTATKRAESVRDIPASITAISGESLEEHGQLNLIDFIAQTPGVTATQGNSGYTRFTMRGISTDTGPTSPSPSPVGVFIGDTAFTDPYIANIVPDLSAFDLAGVQVLRGPQGTLFGGAALSGAVRYELQEPVFGEWQARAFTQFTSPSGGSAAFTSGAAANVPLNEDNLALRVGYVRRNYPGVYDDLQTGEKDVDHGGGNQYRAIVLWRPEDWSIKVTHLFQDFHAPNAIYTADSADGPRENSVNVLKVPATNKFGMDSFEAGYDFESMKVVSLSSYLFKDSIFNIDATPAIIGAPPIGYPPALGFLSPVTENSRAFSQEIRLQSTGSDPFQWLVGGYYYRYHLYFNILIDTPLNQALTGPDSALVTLAARLGIPLAQLTENLELLNGTSDVTSTERALFFDLSYKLWDRLDLSAGARLYETKVAGGFVATGILLRAENNGMNSDTRDQIAERGVNPKLTATYAFTRDVSVYLQIAKGFRFGGIQYVPSTPTNGVPPTFKSDSLWNYEIGLRTSWLDRTLNADLTAFFINYKNPIITQATPGIPINYNDNVSSAISRGLEANLLWNTPLRGLSIALTAALTDAHITSPFQAANGEEIESGQEMPGTAPQQYHATIEYLRPIGKFVIGGSTGYTYVGQGYSDLQHSVEINGYGTLDAGLTLGTDAFRFNPKLALNVSNILNETRPNAGGAVTPLVPLGDLYAYGLIAPRTYSLRLSVDF
ncbi:TonB-dependent receptor [Solimonas terrae]|uniref:TonB-dependent receptor n=2 Tax=Solimonas terrae TaxID=1396819 RepID=A0A6M2BP59_9GAMM|nr:TonB-dependent receptor [Solimonas terrae]